MDFDAFIDQAWTDHATDPAAVATRLPQALAAVASADQLGSLAHLAQHVHGAHLARWQEGIAFQQQLAALSHCAAGSPEAQSIARTIAALRLAGGLGDDRTGATPSDRVRLSALAAIHLAEHDATRAAAFLQQALDEAAGAALPDKDPCHRALAVAGNNMAGTLEDKPTRTEAERLLMIQAAQTGRRFWAIAGTWLETERAEYRLAMTWLKADDLAQARTHAQQCLEIVAANDGAALERFFGWEALGRVERAAGNATGHAQALAQAEQAFAGLEAGDRGWCQASLDALKATTA
jgi:hypothetical protein